MAKDIKKWDLLGRKYLMKEPWLTVRKDHLQLPSGVEIEDYYILEYPDWVNVIAITDEGYFIILQQYRPGLDKVCYEICGGVCEKGETPLETAQRELMEETGFSGGEWKPLMSLSANAGVVNNLTHTFIAQGVHRVGEQHLEPTEDIVLNFMTAEEVKRLLLAGEFVQALMAAPLWRYFYESKL